MKSSLLTSDKTEICKAAVAKRAEFFQLNLLVHIDCFLTYGEDDELNALVAIQSALYVAEEELSAHVGQELISMLA